MKLFTGLLIKLAVPAYLLVETTCHAFFLRYIFQIVGNNPGLQHWGHLFIEEWPHNCLLQPWSPLCSSSVMNYQEKIKQLSLTVVPLIPYQSRCLGM